MNRDYQKLLLALASLQRKYPLIRNQLVAPDPSCEHKNFDFCIELMDKLVSEVHGKKTLKTQTKDALTESRLANMAKGRELSGNKGGRPAKEKAK